MVLPGEVILLVGSYVAALLLVTAVLRFARRNVLLAVPNERSSHDAAKPTIGGIAIVVPALAFLTSVALEGEGMALGMLLAGSGLALIGLLDDVREVHAGVRFLVQMLAVAVLLWCVALEVSPLALAVIGFLLLWHINAFNFMDGIDGIAGIQVMIFTIGTQLLGGGQSGWTAELQCVLAGATLGFLAFNWPPAKIFMGDVGSPFIGLVLGALVIELARVNLVPFVASAILLAGFWFDASYTLCVRILTGQKFTQAHRSHLYQRVSDRLGHLRTTLLFALSGAVWLLPLAWLSTRQPDWRLIILLVAVLPYLAGTIAFQAGLPANEPRK